MPQINKIDVPRHRPQDPYHHTYDNIPADALSRRINLVNNSVDANTSSIVSASGTTGSLNNRISKSLHNNGELKKEAVENTAHSVGSHADDVWDDPADYQIWQASRKAPFVRMTKDESEKLAKIQNEANRLIVLLDTSKDQTQTINSGSLHLGKSGDIEWIVESDGKVNAILRQDVIRRITHHVPSLNASKDAFSVDGIVPVDLFAHVKVFVNGTQLFPESPIPIPTTEQTSGVRLLTYDRNNGYFTLSNALLSTDVVWINV